MMKVTAIEQNGNYKYKIFLDEVYAFWLSWKEIKYFKIKEGSTISEEQFQKIMKEVVLEKCKRKALSYLNLSDQTEYELRQKLKRQLYVEEIVEQAIAYLYCCHYLDDERYIQYFIERNKNIHSKRWIEQKLQIKGIRKEQLLEYWGEDYTEENAIEKAVHRKLKGRKIADRAEREKVLGYLFRQGYSVSSAMRVIRNYEEKMLNTQL